MNDTVRTSISTRHARILLYYIIIFKSLVTLAISLHFLTYFFHNDTSFHMESPAMQSATTYVTDMWGDGDMIAQAICLSIEWVLVQQRSKQISTLPAYVHCSGHCPKLEITKLCSLPDVRNVIERLQCCCLFLYNSPKDVEMCHKCATHREEKH